MFQSVRASYEKRAAALQRALETILGKRNGFNREKPDVRSRADAGGKCKSRNFIGDTQRIDCRNFFGRKIGKKRQIEFRGERNIRGLGG